MFRGTATVASTNQLILRLMEHSTGGQVFPSSKVSLTFSKYLWNLVETGEDYIILEENRILEKLCPYILLN